MNKLQFKYILAIVTVLMMSGNFVNGQCISFAKNSCIEKLGEYIHDGNYNATKIVEGENAELFKTFFSGQMYRMVVCREDNLPSIHIQVMDNDRNVLYDNSNYDMLQLWDFEVASTQLLIIRIEVLERKERVGDLLKGCMAIMFGIK